MIKLFPSMTGPKLFGSYFSEVHEHFYFALVFNIIPRLVCCWFVNVVYSANVEFILYCSIEGAPQKKIDLDIKFCSSASNVERKFSSRNSTTQMKASEQYFPVVLFIMLYKVILTFESVAEILKYDHSNESY